MKVIVLPEQTLLDIAIQVYGDITGVFRLAEENGLEVTDTLMPGEYLDYYPEGVVNKDIAQYYGANDMACATASDFNLERRIFDKTFDLTFG